MLFLADSLYIALSGKTLDAVINPELREEWLVTKSKVFPRTDTAENAAYDKHSPGTNISMYVRGYLQSVKFLL